jgi:hypothetical protein
MCSLTIELAIRDTRPCYTILQLTCTYIHYLNICTSLRRSPAHTYILYLYIYTHANIYMPTLSIIIYLSTPLWYGHPHYIHTLSIYLRYLYIYTIAANIYMPTLSYIIYLSTPLWYGHPHYIQKLSANIYTYVNHLIFTHTYTHTQTYIHYLHLFETVTHSTRLADALWAR